MLSKYILLIFWLVKTYILALPLNVLAIVLWMMR